MLPRVKHVKALSGHKLQLTFTSGEAGDAHAARMQWPAPCGSG